MIKSKQILDEVELKLGKLKKDITEEDLDKIEELNIHRFDLSGSKEDFYLEDLKLFNSLESITFDHMSLDENILGYLSRSNINKLAFRNCELLCEIEHMFNNINNLSIEFVDNFKDEYLDRFPYLDFLSYRGYDINYLPGNIRVLDISESNVMNNNVFLNTNFSEIYVSKDEYEKNKKLYTDTSFKVNVYDSNKCYLDNEGDYNE